MSHGAPISSWCTVPVGHCTNATGARDVIGCRQGVVVRSAAIEVEGRPSRLTWCAVVAGVAGVLYAAYSIRINPLRPHVSSPRGYYAWIDQSYYLRSARVLAHFHLPSGPHDYMYGLGYPVLGAVFYDLGFKDDPFAPVNALAYGVICALTFVLAVRLWRTTFGGSAARSATLPVVGFAAVAMLTFATPLFPLVITPWNSTVVVLTVLAILILVVSERALTWPRACAIGALLGWTFATRYGDVVFAGLPVAATLLVRSGPERRRLLLGAGGVLLAIVALVAYTQYHAFGNPFLTPYHFHTRVGPGLGNDQSLGNYRLRWIPRHFLSTVITGPAHGALVGNEPMLRQFPLLVLAPFGVVALIRRAGRMRAVWVAVVVAGVLSSLFYLSFIAGGGDDLKFWNLRYWAIWYAPWAMFALLGAAAIFHRFARSQESPTRA